MNARPSWAIIALLALFTATPSLAQDAPAPAASPAPVASPPPATAQSKIAGRGSVGGLIGSSLFYADEEYSKGAQPRFDFNGQFRYVMSPRFRLQVSPGFTWSGYSKKEPPPFTDPKFPEDQTKENYLTMVVPVSAQIQFMWGKAPWLYHVGVGPGGYRVWVENHRKVLIDPTTLRLHRGIYLGTTAELGVEHFLKTLPNTSIEFSTAHHYVLATRDDQFPNGWNSPLGILAFRVGANYYFDLNQPKKSPDLPLPGAK